MTVTAGHLGRPQSQLGGRVSPGHYPALPPPSYIVQPDLRLTPTLSGPEQPPNIRVVAVNPGGLLHAAHPPVLLHADMPPPLSLRSLFMQDQSNPSSCRLNLHTKDQCKDRQLCGYKSTVQPPHTQVDLDLSVSRLDFIPSSVESREMQQDLKRSWTYM